MISGLSLFGRIVYLLLLATVLAFNIFLIRKVQAKGMKATMFAIMALAVIVPLIYFFKFRKLEIDETNPPRRYIDNSAIQ